MSAPVTITRTTAIPTRTGDRERERVFMLMCMVCVYTYHFRLRTMLPSDVSFSYYHCVTEVNEYAKRNAIFANLGIDF